MSTAVNDALFARWGGAEDLSDYPDAAAAQAALVAKLAVITIQTADGAKSKPAIHFGNKSKVVRYPAITFRPGGGIEAFAAAGLPPIDGAIYDVEIWDNSEDSSTITDIDGYLGILTDRRRRSARNWRAPAAPPLQLGAGQCFYMHRLNDLSLLYDPGKNAWFGLTRFRIIEAQF